MRVRIDTDGVIGREPADNIQRYAEFDVVSIGTIGGNDVVTFMVDAETREYAVIETGSRFFGGLVV